MKTALTYMAATVFLLAAAGCSENPGGGELSGDGTVELSMDIAATRSGSGDEVPDKEKIYTLRVIIFGQDGDVEYNGLVYDSTEGVSEVSSRTFKVRENEGKTIFLLANVEDIDGLDLENADGLRDRIEGYGDISPEYLQSAESLPMSSSYSYTVRDVNVDCGTLYVAAAAVKFTFTFENSMATGLTLGISGITVNQVASLSWLYPHGVDTRWLTSLVDKDIITDYTIPSDAVHSPYEATFDRVTVASGASVTLPPFYLTESRNEISGVQEYSVSLKIGTGDSGDGDLFRDAGLTNGDGPLNSLFRCTHVDVHVNVKSLEQIEIYDGIYGMINPWEELPPVSGSITEL